MSENVIEIRDNDFEEKVLGQERPTIVDFLGSLVWAVQGHGAVISKRWLKPMAIR